LKIGLTNLPYYHDINLLEADLIMSEPVNFGTFAKAALPDQIAERILKMIQDKELKPGDKLPPERELAVSIGVGRPALREALRGLSLINVIEIRQGDGAYVTNLDTAQLVQHLNFVFSLDDSAIMDLFDARNIVEVGIIELAAQRIQNSEIVELEACLEKSAQTAHDPDAFLQADLELHLLIARIARNPVMFRIMESIQELGLVSRRRTGYLPGVVEQSTADHRQIVDALKARNPQLAREAMRQHLNNVKKKLESLVDEPEV
jgi:GntR family transcriptional repressor for pyruvate dehydrogenase complex